MSEEQAKRKLAAILSADAKDYSRLMEDDEEATVRTITAYRELMVNQIQNQNGRIVDAKGDNLLAEFSSVVDAVRCAVEIQKQLGRRNAELPEYRKMEFRIGVNLGDVIEEDETIYGDGVNIAARLEALAEGGGICISGTAFDHIRKRLSVGYEYLGEQAVKNIETPVRVYRVLMEPEAVGKVIGEQRPKPKRWRRAIIGGVAVLIILAGVLAIWNFYFRPAPIEPASAEKMAYPLPENPSIAVLPFANLSEDQKQEYLADAITENIISVLSRVPRMFVIARNSTFTFKGKPVKVKRVAEEFGVQYVLEGSVQRSGDRIRITAQLIDALNARHLWSERYDRELKDIYALQDYIAREVLRALQVKLTEGEGAAFRLKYEPNIDVYLKFLQARDYLTTGVKDDNIKARKMANEIISSDPKFAHGYTLLARVEYTAIWLGLTKSPEKSRERAMELAKESIEIEDNPEAHSILANIYKLLRKYDEAIAEAKKSIEMVPNNADSYNVLGDVLIYTGRAQEAIPILKKAIRLNPLPPARYFLVLAWAYFLSDKYEEGIEAARAAVRIRPESALIHRMLAACYVMAGREEEARAEASEVLRLDPNFSISEQKARVGSSIKDKNQAKKWYDALRKAGLRETPPLPLPDKPSIAVLPFVNMSSDPGQEYFSDGITEEIITALSKVPDLFVIARNSTFTYKGKPVKVQQVGRELGVRHVLEGSVRKAEDKVRVTAQLVDAVTGKHLWAERYDRDLKDIFALQDEITMKIITELQVKLTEGERVRGYAKGTDNLEAYLKFLQGSEHYRRLNKEDNARARQMCEEAIALDPEYPQAYATLGWTHWIDVWLKSSRSPGESISKAFELAQKSISLDDSCPSGHLLLSNLYLITRQHEKAIAEGERAITLDPNSADAYAIFGGQVLIFSGKPEEGALLVEKAIRLNPIAPSYYLHMLGMAYRETGRYEESITACKKAIKRQPNNIFAHLILVATYSMLGREDAARATAAEVLRIDPEFSVEHFAKTRPHIDPANTARFADALRKAGLK